MATRSAGFTLIELLAVMAVMVMLTTIVVASGFGIRRGTAYNAAERIPQSVLEYAHQRACMDGRKTAVLFAPDDAGVFSASIFQTAGTVFESEASAIVDNFSDLATMEKGQGANVLTVFNFRTGNTFIVGEIFNQQDNGKVTFNNGDDSSNGNKNTYYYPRVFIKQSEDDKTHKIPGNWPDGSAYGFEIAERQIMPNNFTYTHTSGGNTKGDSFWFVFNPDGSTEKHRPAVITVKETVGSQKFKKEISFNN